MNFNKFINSDYLKSNPLCGIDTYKDELNLATGVCTRQIKKLVLTGNEDWELVGSLPLLYFRIRVGNINTVIQNMINSTHLPQNQITSSTTVDGVDIRNVQTQNAAVLNVRSPEMGTSTDDFKSYLAAQYAAGTPVIAWYALSEPTTETITVPSGLSGTEEGFLNQSGTPTPTNPIYPTANTVEKWFDLNHYIMGTDTDTITTLPAVLYPNAVTATVGVKGRMAQSGTPSPTTPIQPQECGDLETEGAKAGQYKIPILSGGTTTPVYLGEVQSTRRIGKLVLDGNTSINDYAGGASKVGFVTQGTGILGNRTLGKCTHFQTQSTGVGSTIDGVTFGINNSTIYFTFSAASVATYNLSDVASIKQYLADQYAAGTPVTVWYVLATPTTGIVNEPIRKIGAYADEISGITIPVTAGANILSVDTTLQPSEVSVNYHGWHPVADVHERDNGAWT